MSAGLEIRGLCKAFGGVTVARDIDLALAPGDRTALIGPNGAGKTTLLNLITGILAPDSGEIRLDGRDLAGLNEAQRVRAGIARTFQITTLFGALTLRENLRLPILERERRAAVPWRRAAGFPAIEDEIAERLDALRLAPLADRPVGTLAYGEQRLVELAMALALHPRVLILDEPAAGVPSSELRLIVDAIAALPDDLAILIVEHDMKVVFELAHRIVVLVDGAVLASGPPAEIAADAQVRALYLGTGHG